MKNNIDAEKVSLSIIPQGMKTTIGEILELVKADINATDELEGLDFEIVDMIVFGSRTKNKARKNSDIDILLQYKGKAREDDMFNAFHRIKTKIDNIIVDITPINEPIKKWLKRMK